jgi:hypothetical protein
VLNAQWGIEDERRPFLLRGFDRMALIGRKNALEFPIRSTAGEQVLIEKFTGGAGPGWTFTKLSDQSIWTRSGKAAALIPLEHNTHGHTETPRPTCGRGVSAFGSTLASWTHWTDRALVSGSLP